MLALAPVTAQGPFAFALCLQPPPPTHPRVMARAKAHSLKGEHSVAIELRRHQFAVLLQWPANLLSHRGAPARAVVGANLDAWPPKSISLRSEAKSEEEVCGRRREFQSCSFGHQGKRLTPSVRPMAA